MVTEIEVVCDQESSPDLNVRSPEYTSDVAVESTIPFVPTICSGSFADIGLRGHMEDEHVRIDDLSMCFGPPSEFPKPNAFYGVFDGHGGSEASAYIKRNVTKLFLNDVSFPQRPEVDDTFLEEAQNSLRKAFLQADQALAVDHGVGSSGTTALTVMIFGRFLLVANVGDCRAVLCRKGKAIEMSKDHRPTNLPELLRVEELGGTIKHGYLNGVIAVTRALGDRCIKLTTPSLIAEPDIQKVMLTEDDEFLIIGCDGIWDVISSQSAVRLVRHRLRRHGDPGKCARSLVMKALCRGSVDNLTAIVVCFSSLDQREPSPPPQRTLMCWRSFAV